MWRKPAELEAPPPRSPESQADQGSNWSPTAIKMDKGMLLMPDFTYSATPHLALFNANRTSCLSLGGCLLDGQGTSVTW